MQLFLNLNEVNLNPETITEPRNDKGGLNFENDNLLFIFQTKLYNWFYLQLYFHENTDVLHTTLLKNIYFLSIFTLRMHVIYSDSILTFWHVPYYTNSFIKIKLTWHTKKKASMKNHFIQITRSSSKKL